MLSDVVQNSGHFGGKKNYNKFLYFYTY